MTETQQQLTVKNLFGRDEVRNKFQEMLGKRAPSFITSVLQIVASNTLLAKADPHSVYHSAAVAATLDLPLNNNLGFAYIVPYNESYQENGSWQTRQVAQFQMGYKGYIQLAQRSGQFKTLNAVDVREGELKLENKLTGEYIFEWIQDEEVRETKKIIGFVSYFKLINGFEKVMYMSVKKLNSHGIKYSQTFKKGKGRWKDDFDAMALKTVIKLNISKYAPLSVDMQKAITFDQAVIKDSDTQDVSYVDNQPEQIETITVEQLQEIFDTKVALLGAEDFKNIKRIIENKEETSYGKAFKLLTELSE
jgi:recombination protein RecT